MQQKRLILAVVLSSAILFIWSYLYPVKPPKNNPQTAGASPSASPSSSSANNAAPNQTSNSAQTPAGAQNAAPQRIITVKTPLYEAKFDTRGAEPISWIIKRNKNSGAEIFSVARKKSDRIPLELISPEGLKRQPRQVPLQIQTGDASLDGILASATYRLEGLETNSTGNLELNLAPGEKKPLVFALDDSSGVQIRKTLIFDGDTYATDLSVTVKRAEQPVPIKLSIGPSIGDQGIVHHTFYSVAPEAVGFVNSKIERHQAVSINGNKNSPDRLVQGGSVDWAGVGDTYFAMVAVPL